MKNSYLLIFVIWEILIKQYYFLTCWVQMVVQFVFCRHLLSKNCENFNTKQTSKSIATRKLYAEHRCSSLSHNLRSWEFPDMMSFFMSSEVVNNPGSSLILDEGRKQNHQQYHQNLCKWHRRLLTQIVHIVMSVSTFLV